MDSDGPAPLDESIRHRMQRQRRSGSKPELALRRELHRRGLRYRVDVRPPGKLIRGRVDILFGPAKVAVLVDGCFWHGCPDHWTQPKNNGEWWRRKIEANRERDRRTDETLTANGYLVIRVWEHEDTAVAADRVATEVLNRRPHPSSQRGSGD